MSFNMRIFLFAFFIALTAYTREVAVTPQFVDCPRESGRGQTFQMLIAGEYPNMCYSMGETYVEIKDTSIYIKDTADVTEGSEDYCLLENYQLKPYRKILDVTPQNGGFYNIFFMNENGEAIPYATITIH